MNYRKKISGNQPNRVEYASPVYQFSPAFILQRSIRSKVDRHIHLFIFSIQIGIRKFHNSPDNILVGRNNCQFTKGIIS